MVDISAENPVEHAKQFPPTDVADMLVDYLEQLDVEFVFGIPGGAIEPLYNALARSERRGGPKAIVARHETGAAFMADGYHNQTGHLGVCCSTTGPGATNLITGVASAYANNTPLLVITAQTAMNSFGKGAFQDSSCTGVNVTAMLEHCTHYNTLVSHADQFEHKLATAVMTAFGSPPGPVHLSIPVDVMRSQVSPSSEPFDLYRLIHPEPLLDTVALEQLCQTISSSNKVAFLVGEGACESVASILRIVEKLDADLLTTPHGKGIISPYHPRYRGVVGFAGHQSALETLRDPSLDAVICIGTALSEWASNGWDSELLLNARLIHIDQQECNFTHTPMARLHVRGRISTICETLLKYLSDLEPSDASDPATAQGEDSTLPSAPFVDDAPPRSNSSVGKINATAEDSYTHRRYFTLNDEDAYCDDSSPIKPQRLMRELSRLFPPYTYFLADIGTSFAWAIHYLHPFDRRMNGARASRGGCFRTCLEFASMGWAIGHAVGAALGCKRNPVVCITGDGSFLMSGQEITVAIQENLPVIYIVLNDSSLGMVKQGQRLTGAEAIGTKLATTDFAAMAQAVGAKGYRIRSPEDLLNLDINALCVRAGPSLLDVYIDPDEVAPIHLRTTAIKKAL